MEITDQSKKRTLEDEINKIRGQEREIVKSLKKLSRLELFIPGALQFLMWVPTRVLLKFFVSFEVFGHENLRSLEKLKKNGKLEGVIFAANHASELDPIAIRAAMRSLSNITPLYFVARVRSHYNNKGFLEKYIYGGRFFRWWGAYPAYSGMEDYEKSLVHHIDLLKRGKSLLIFPEGGKTRDGKLREAHGGIAFLSHELGLPVVPVNIEGTYKLGRKGFFLRRNKTRVSFGEVRYPEHIFKERVLLQNPGREDYRLAATYILNETQRLAKNSLKEQNDSFNKNMNDSILKVEDLKKVYPSGTEAVRGISFEVKKGEIFGILGPNGAGKTTTLEMLETLHDISGGKAEICGIDVQKNPEQIKRIIGVQPQSSGFQDKTTLTELLELFGACYGEKVDTETALRDVGLSEKRNSYIENLSGGQRQRFSIAAALIHQPKVFFMDEPTTGLDPQARRNLWDLIREVRRKGVTVVLTTHYMDEAELLCNRVAVMDQGKIIALDPPKELIKQLLDRGFTKEAVVEQANLEDVFIDLTGKELRE